MSDFQIENGVLVKYKGKAVDVTIPDSVSSIGEEAFSWCSSLTSITIPDSVSSIGDRAFNECSSLTNITIPDSVSAIGYFAFFWCSSLTSINLPDSVSSIGDRAFYCCRNLTSITIPGAVSSIGNEAFSGCNKLKSINIPDSVSSIGWGAFAGCSSLTSITILSSASAINGHAFLECSNLKEFTCPSSFATQLQTILPKTQAPITLHIPDISDVSAKFRPGAAVGFAEDNRDCSDENGKKYVKYIKTNAAKLAGVAIEHPALLYLMIREKLIAAKSLEAVTNAVQASGNAELIAAMLDYGNNAVSEKAKAKVQAKKEERETNVTNFVFDAEKLEALSGKTFVVTGKLKTFVSRDELNDCLTTCGAVLTETLTADVNYLITNTPNSGTAKNKKAIELGVQRITEAQFNQMIGRTVQK